MCYTYDELSRVTERTVKRISDDYIVSYESFVYDAAGNIIGADADTAFVYDVNNRLTSFNGNAVSYDADGNMLSNGVSNFTYDSANRLVSADGYTYVYNAEDVRIRAVHNGVTTTYTYNTNAKLSQLLVTETNGVTTKYVYGLGLIGEETNNGFKTYHFDYRGSTVAITNVNGTVTDTFTYNTYGKLTNRTGNSDIIFLYNGRDGVITEPNGLLYMRARYYSPDMRRFINADIIPGEISNAVTLNRYAYANGNPINMGDPMGNWPRWITATVAIVAAVVTVAAVATGNIAVASVAAKITIAAGATYIAQSAHYDRREAKNDVATLPQSPQEAKDLDWRGPDTTPKGPAADCHQYTAKDGPNIKYVSPDGHREVIYNSQKKIVLDARDIGTYNFCPSDERWYSNRSIGHLFHDIIPWVIFGNSDDDPGWVANEILRLFE